MCMWSGAMPQLWATRLCTSRQWCWTLVVTLSMVMALQLGLFVHPLKLRLAFCLFFACCSCACVIIHDEKSVFALACSVSSAWQSLCVQIVLTHSLALSLSAHLHCSKQAFIDFCPANPSMPTQRFLSDDLSAPDLTAVLLLHLMPYPHTVEAPLPPPVPFQHGGK